MGNDIKNYLKSYSVKAKELRLARIHAQLNCDDTSKEFKEQWEKANENLLKAKREEAEFREIYAKEIYNYCNNRNPWLIRNRDSKKISWKEAFGSNYSDLSPELKGSIIALIEEDGGQYRFAKDLFGIFYF